MNTPQVSIIISVYNEEKYIAACLHSLKHQDYANNEIIVVDDGSTDNTATIVKNFQNIMYLTAPHTGPANARNLGVKKAHGEIVVFLDADMEFEKNFISQLVQPILKDKTKGTFSKLEYVKNWDKPFARCWNRMNEHLPDKLRVLQDKEVGDDFRAILRSEFLKVQGFDNIGYTDTWTLKKKLGYSPINAPEAIYYHNNPETFTEVYESAMWIGKREYKGGKIGTTINVLRSCLYLLTDSVVKTLKYSEPAFIPFCIAYYGGFIIGGIRFLFLNEKSK